MASYEDVNGADRLCRYPAIRGMVGGRIQTTTSSAVARLAVDMTLVERESSTSPIVTDAAGASAVLLGVDAETVGLLVDIVPAMQ